jgi:23S rRNA (cytidine1920-2'-O)/16S rRNA (cytidine1409-2'-O)-methyltransferase
LSEGKKIRLDLLLVARGLAESRARAQWLIRQGRVLCAGQPCLRPGATFFQDTPLQVTEPMPYVSRGGLKLAHALDVFALCLQGQTVLDVGASTGGFTDCLLQHGASRVFAVDVGRAQLHPRLHDDPRVIAMEETDIRDLSALPGGVLADLAVVDVSFISLRLVLPALPRLLKPNGQILALVKPQFEVGLGVVGKKGIVRSEKDRRRALDQVAAAAEAQGLQMAGIVEAPRGQERGNVEYVVHLKRLSD